MKDLKSQLRTSIKRQKSDFGGELLCAKSDGIITQLEQLPQFIRAKTVLAYWSMPDEVQTHAFINRWHGRKKISLPVVLGDRLEPCFFEGMDSMGAGAAFGILEPKNTLKTPLNDIDLIIVPGLAFDSNGNRLGRGKGYYDRLLKGVNAFKVGICFDFQIVEKVPTGTNDIPVDKVIWG